jgi:AmmeMemoRadiSam system protein A
MSEVSEPPGGPLDSVLGLSAEEKETLLRVARQTLHDYLSRGEIAESGSDRPALLQPCATFVTLWRRDSGELRGCRGECHARRSLLESVTNMAVAAGVDDSRFASVTIEEMPDLRIEINALTPMEPIEPKDVVIGRHGLLIVSEFSMGLLLPDVAVRYKWDREDFLKAVCRKAGLPGDAWKGEGVQLFGFESEAWAEEE